MAKSGFTKVRPRRKYNTIRTRSSFPIGIPLTLTLTITVRLFCYLAFCTTATFAGKWACMGSFSAEAPNMTEENDLSGRMQE